MKTRIFTLGALLSGLVACSSMAPETPETNLRALPEDFDAQVYAELNPDIRIFQFRKLVQAKNTQWRTERLDTLKSDLETLLAGFTPEEMQADLALPDTQSIIRRTGLMGAEWSLPDWLSGEMSDADFFGINGEATIGIIITADNDSYLLDTLLIGDIFTQLDSSAYIGANTASSPQRTLQRTAARLYNILGQGGEADSLRNFEVNLELATIHFQAFGIPDGRAYRNCNGDAGVPRSEITPVQQIYGTSTFNDYSEYLYCFNTSDSTIYSIR